MDTAKPSLASVAPPMAGRSFPDLLTVPFGFGMQRLV